MSKVPMKQIFICGLKKDRKQILELLQMEGIVEIRDFDPEDEYFKTMDVMSQKAQFDKNSNVAEQALSVLEKYAPEEKTLLSSFEDVKDMARSEYDRYIVHVDTYIDMAASILRLEKQIQDAEDRIPSIENRQAELGPWISFDLPMDFRCTELTEAFIGTVPFAADQEDLGSKLSESSEGDAELPVAVSVISSSKEMSCIFLVCLKKDVETIKERLKDINFSMPKSSTQSCIPSEEIKQLDKQKQKLRAEIQSCKEKIAAYSSAREDLKLCSDYFTMRAEKYTVLDGLPQSESTFFINGYVPAHCADVLCQRITGLYDVYIDIEEPGEDEDVPVLLTNGTLSEPIETVVESYSLPGRNEIDPSKITSIFYYIFFGMMLSDAGYGILLSLSTAYVLLKVKNIKPGMKKMMKLFFYGGISTIFWGLAFGSFFGNAVNVIATTFFNRPDIKLRPLWFEPMSEPMRFLVFAFGCGIVHLFTGLGIKFYQCVKQGDMMGAFCDSVLWFMFAGGGIVYLLTMPMVTNMLGLKLSLGSTVATVAAVVTIAGCIGVVLTGGRESRNWFKRILKGAYAAYGITGYLSDILSYSRLLALGLATGVIAQVFNQMGSMLGATWYGALIFIAIFLIGHILNIGINVLGAYVHTNRLQFVEFFGKFYDGGGKRFEPFTEKTKYFKVKEDK